jgi:hypothetical protein
VESIEYLREALVLLRRVTERLLHHSKNRVTDKEIDTFISRVNKDIPFIYPPKVGEPNVSRDI